MITTSLRRGVLPGVAAIAVVATLAACGSSDNASDGGNTPSGLSGNLAAGGSSAQEKAQEAWRAGFGGQNPDVTITYDPVGSGTGRDNFYSGAYKFAGSDSAIADEDMAAAKAGCLGTDPIEIPVFISPIDVIFNLDGIETLNLDAKTIAQIFSGKITKWNDPAIAAQNDGVSLPDLAIAPVHRSDSSGTTENFTEYLAEAGDGAWTAEPDSEWPTQSGEAAEKTAGMIAAVTDGKGTIGYADDSAVKSTSLGKVAIKVGETYTAPSADGAATALSASNLIAGKAESQLVYHIDRATTEAGAYPLFMASYFLACQTYADANEAEVVKQFGLFITSEAGQKAASVNAGSAPMPADIAAKAKTILEGISAK